ncbi:MAG: sterol desaturase family protein [Tabrizicola sp.]|uniref:sterol desaturase family protein n=1 Tax=Tabrizicola sp. TaxID=2005166 RepID=UPI002ABA2374|nr:sterol desaturase family protein [Tabrizicola sp.]MDZ4088132.1 sterol desaturase family protein [Tabrizicola sp.]
MESIRFVYEVLFGPGLVTAPVYLALAGLAAWGVWRWRGEGDGFWRWLVPARIWGHPSHWIDLQLFVLGRVLAVLGLFGGVALTTAVAAWVAGVVPALLPATSLGPVALAFLLWLPSDFALYWMHRFFHRWSVIWPLHAVHHSAEVMTPFTTYRQHPLSILLTGWGVALFVGLCQGLLLGAADGDLAVAEIAGINLFIVLANAGLAALHHSHVWLSYGPLVERILISPAQHQIHHSTDPAHYGKNLGNSLAVWDWMFGTLYVIRGDERLTFGLTEDMEKPLMSQRLWPVLWDPVRRMLRRA